MLGGGAVVCFLGGLWVIIARCQACPLCRCLGNVPELPVYFRFKVGFVLLCRVVAPKGRNGKFGHPVSCDDALTGWVHGAVLLFGLNYWKIWQSFAKMKM